MASAEDSSSDESLEDVEDYSNNASIDLMYQSQASGTGDDRCVELLGGKAAVYWPKERCLRLLRTRAKGSHPLLGVAPVARGRIRYLFPAGFRTMRIRDALLFGARPRMLSCVDGHVHTARAHERFGRCVCVLRCGVCAYAGVTYTPGVHYRWSWQTRGIVHLGTCH